MGGDMHGIQAWVALPDEHEETEPSFAHFGAAALPVHDDRGTRIRLIAGSAYGLRSAVTTHSPLFYAHWELDAGARAALPDEYPDRACYIADGEIEAQGRRFGAGKMLVFEKGEDSTVAAVVKSTLMALGGEPVGERFIEWNFVSSSRHRIEQAKADWRAGRMKLPDFDNQEFIPLA
jgi:redox-sensitive bicupin YhaK (pirin superfamily)